jgi:cytochrome c oxidase accessory protein FixG
MAQDFRETLYTIDRKGRRKWVYNSLADGFWHHRRKFVAYSLLAFYLGMPWIEINGRQGILFDLSRLRFVFFGVEFWATDTQFIFFALCLLAFSLFLFTAVFGRVWCGWACPETVFLEFLFRPIERLIEGNGAKRARLDMSPWTPEKIGKKLLKHGLCAFFSWVIASTALAYFIGREPLLAMMTDWPLNHPGPFIATLTLMGLMAFQFGWFREQFCTALCPYARFQSVLMDSSSIVVGYDVVRGEPRGKLQKQSQEGDKLLGDCIDCGLCVRVCPTGIDIRNGLQLECIACTQCIDACDSIMKSIKKPPGLIRYDTENRLLGRTQAWGLIRPRPFVYGALVLLFATLFIYNLSTRELTEVKITRGASDKPFSILADGRISNHLHAQVSNKSTKAKNYMFQVLDNSKPIELLTPLAPLPVPASSVQVTPLFLNFDSSLLEGGKLHLSIQVKDDADFNENYQVTLLGPGK